MAKPGPKELQRRALREARARPRAGSVSRSTIAKTGTLLAAPNLDAQAAIDAANQETDVKKPKTKTAPKRKPAAKIIKAKAPKKAAASKKARAPVPALDVAAFICRHASKDNPLGGASMAELEKKFGIDAHPMRAKIFYVKHTLGYDIESKDGRYHGTPPKAA